MRRFIDLKALGQIGQDTAGHLFRRIGFEGRIVAGATDEFLPRDPPQHAVASQQQDATLLVLEYDATIDIESPTVPKQCHMVHRHERRAGCGPKEDNQEVMPPPGEI